MTIGLLTTYFFGRISYSTGYQEKEGAFNNYRILGSVCVNVAHIATIGVTMLLGYRMVRGNLSLQKALGIAVPK